MKRKATDGLWWKIDGPIAEFRGHDEHVRGLAEALPNGDLDIEVVIDPRSTHTLRISRSALDSILAARGLSITPITTNGSAQVWYASGGDFARRGPYATEQEAREAFRLTRKAQEKQAHTHGTQSPFPHDLVVWSETRKRGA